MELLHSHVATWMYYRIRYFSNNAINTIQFNPMMNFFDFSFGIYFEKKNRRPK